MGRDRHDAAELRAGSRLGEGADRGAGDAGNASQNNTTDHSKDNRVDYFFGGSAAGVQSVAPTTVPAHWSALAAAHVIGVAFGAGAGEQTTPETDGGYLVSKTKAYVSAGGQPLCQ